MSRLPRLKGRELVRLLEKLGFEIIRTRGSPSSSDMPTGERLQWRYMLAKLLVPVFCGQYSAMSSCQWRICLRIDMGFIALVLLFVQAGCQTKTLDQQAAASQPTQAHVTTPAPSQPVTPQSIARDMFPTAPEKTRNAECFRSTKPEMSVYTVVETCGRPDEEVGSGMYVFVYHLQDGSTVGISTPYLTRVDDLWITDSRGRTSPVIKAGRAVRSSTAGNPAVR